MGCFDSTCAVTRSAIHAGDKVVLILITGDPDGKKSDLVAAYASTYEILNTSIQKKRAIERLTKQQESFNSIPDEQIDAKKLGATFLDFLESDATGELDPVKIQLIIGTYNDYGWIEEIQRDYNYTEDYNMYSCFIHKWVADTICGEDISQANWIDALYKIASFAFQARVQLFGNYILGEQQGVYSKEERSAYSLLIEMMQRALTEVYDNRLQELEEHYDN